MQETLPIFKNKIEKSIARLQEFEPPEGYYLAFSGGKDSVVIYTLAQMAGVKFDAHYNVTTVDPPELVHFIRDEWPDVEWNLPELTMWQLIVKKKVPPTRRVRYCCDYLKERGGNDRLVVTGVRWAESHNRKGRGVVESCYRSKVKNFINPIIDWTDDDVWSFIHSEQIKYCCLYDEGLKRLGCVLCPMQTIKSKIKEAERWPKIANQYKRTFDRMVEARIACNKAKTTIWHSGQSVFDWWVNEPSKIDENQKTLFV